MKRLTFLQVLESNIKCAMCENKECPVRYYPERKKFNIVMEHVILSCVKKIEKIILRKV